MSKETRVPPQTTVDLARQLSKLNCFRAVDFQHLNDSYFTFSFHHISFNNYRIYGYYISNYFPDLRIKIYIVFLL
jgi:hypothetical protein